MSCGHVTAMRRILIGGARLRGSGNVAGALCPNLPCNRCEMRSARSRCRVSSNLVTTVLVARQDSGCRITRARRTYIHIRTQSRARARAVKTQPEGHTGLVKPALLGLSMTRSFRKLQSDVLEIQWSVENWVATQFSEASVASARAPSDASGSAALRRRGSCKRRVATQFSEACAGSVTGPVDLNGSAAVKNVRITSFSCFVDRVACRHLHDAFVITVRSLYFCGGTQYGGS